MRTNCLLRSFVLLCVIMAAKAGMGIAITNGDFENGFTDWRYYAVGGAATNFTIVNDAYTGSGAASMEVTAFPGGDTALDKDSNRIAVSKGDAVKIELAAKKISTGATRLMLSVSEFNSSGAFLGIQSNYFVAAVNGAYNAYSFVHFITSADTAYMNIAFRIVDDWGLTTTGHYYIDAVAVSEGQRIYNGGFEEGMNGWRAYAVGGAAANFSLSSDAYEGANAFSFNITAGGGDHGLDRWESKFPAQQGEVIGFSVATKKISTGDTTLKLVVSEWDASGNFLGVEGTFDLTSGVGVYQVSEFGYTVSHASTAKLNMSFRLVDQYNTKVPGHYLIDSVNIVDMPRIYNGGFESGLFGWRGYAVGGGEGTYTISSDAYEGINAVLMSITNGAGDHALDRENSKIYVDPNAIVTFSFAAKRVSPDERTVRFTVSEFDVNGAYLGNHGTFDFKPQTSGYQEYEYTYAVSNPICVKVNISFTIYEANLSAKSTGQMLIDNVKLVNTQYVNNGGFEKNFDGWRYYAVGGAVADYTISNDAYEGNNAALMTVTTAGLDQALDRDGSKMPVSAGENILVSFAAKNASGADTLLLLNVSEFDAAGGYLGKYGLKFVDPATTYGKFNFYYTIQDAGTKLINIAFTIFSGDGSVKSTGSYLIDDVRVVKENVLNVADVNYDFEVNTDDLQIIAENWLANNVVAGGQVMVDDFEGYTNQAALDAKWQEFYWAGFNGSTTSSTATLLTSPADVYAGTKALRWVYNADDTSGDGLNFTDIVLTLNSAMDLRNAQSIVMNINRHAGNSQEYLLYVKFFEGAVDVANVRGQGIWLTRTNGSTYSPTGWSQWTANLDDLVDFDKAQLDQVSAVLIGCYSPELDGTSGTGTIDIDNIKVVYADTCAQKQTGDINGDCAVDLIDTAALAANWLAEIIY